MSNAIDLIWAKLPTFHHNHHEACNDALVAFSGFLPKEIFNSIKPFWEGYILYNDKKIGIYKTDVVEFLLKETFVINLDGTILQKSVQAFPGSLIINKILNVCNNSQQTNIAKMSHKQRQFIIYTQIKRDLWALFLPSEIIDSEEDFKSGEWTTVKPSTNDREYDFNLSRGLLHYEEVKKDSDGKLVTFHRKAYLKNKDELNQLVQFVFELKKYGKNAENLSTLDFPTTWADGFLSDTFQPKKNLYNK